MDTKTNSNIVTLDPNGGLKYNSSNELKVKINSGLRATSTGLTIVNHVQITGDTIIGNLSMGGLYRITDTVAPQNNADVANKEYVDERLKSSGDTMTGNLSMGGNRITNVIAPHYNADAANKAYVYMHKIVWRCNDR